MRFAILTENDSKIIEYSPQEVKRMFELLLEKVEFSVAWDMVIDQMKKELRRK